MNLRTTQPVVIGGLGGSGTRVLAMLLDALGMLQGPTNRALDHTWFGLLLKRPRWHARSTPVQRRQVTHLFRALATDSLSTMPAGTLGTLADALFERLRHPYNHKADLQENQDVLRRLILHYARPSRRPQRPDGRWGFKEPNTYLFLEELADAFPRMRYIHTVRSGLDMAFSSNQNQVLNWGHRFGLHTPSLDALTPERALSFWVRANEHALDLGQRLLGERFMTVEFERLCTSPHTAIAEIMAFLNLPTSADQLHELAQIPRLPPSHGRHRRRDLAQLPSTLRAREAQLRAHAARSQTQPAEDPRS